MCIRFTSASLGACIDRLPEAQREQLVAETLEKVMFSRLPEDFMELFAASEPPVQEVLIGAAQRLSNEDHRSATLAALARSYREDGMTRLMEIALQAASSTRDQTHRTRALAGLAADLPPMQATDVLRDALRGARTIGDDVKQFDARGAILRDLPDHLSSEIASQAVLRLPSILYNQDRCALLRAVSRALEGPQ
jgi:hypothetical protein